MDSVQKKKTKTNPMAWLVLLIVSGGAGWLLNSYSRPSLIAESIVYDSGHGNAESHIDSPGTLSAAFKVEDEVSKFAGSHIVSAEEYAEIQQGMSYSQVKEIIGHSGEELSSNEIGLGDGTSVRTVMYAWANPSGSNMNAMFQNDKLISKAQFGLN